ncbi:MAG: hypothetical protein JWO94_2538 [Verrucomicrobiaceae bacterium]|nr:hypothetical protein [Verrucomicrobiaceae bacterium]
MHNQQQFIHPLFPTLPPPLKGAGSRYALAVHALRPSVLKQDLHIGVVASLHSLGLLDACCREDASIAGWQTITCPGYGSLVRQMRAGRIEAALVPFDWFATHFPPDAGEPSSWQIIKAWPSCALEFWMSRHLKKRLGRLRRAGHGGERSSDHEVRVAVDAASPLLFEWVRQRLAQISGFNDLAVTLQHLPVSLMPASLKAGLVEAMVAPSPWSLAEELSGEGSLDKVSVPSSHDLGLVLVVDSKSDASAPEMIRQLAAASLAPSGIIAPKRLSCSHHAALPLQDSVTINRQLAQLLPPIAAGDLDKWLAARQATLQGPSFPRAASS